MWVFYFSFDINYTRAAICNVMWMWCNNTYTKKCLNCLLHRIWREKKNKRRRVRVHCFSLYSAYIKSICVNITCHARTSKMKTIKNTTYPKKNTHVKNTSEAGKHFKIDILYLIMRYFTNIHTCIIVYIYIYDGIV